MKLHGVDIAGYQKGIDIYNLTANFIIVKATEGTQGTIYNPDYKDMANDVLATGRLLGFYHYANGDDPIAEADSFYEAIKDYKGVALPCLDWEGKGNYLFTSGRDVDWCKTFMDRISSRMNSSCLFYTSKGICRAYDWSEVAKKYPLWGAEYAYEDYVYQGYEENPWDSNSSWGAWGEQPTIHQYGYVNPQPGNGGFDQLDADIFYGTREYWARLCGNTPTQPITDPVNQNGMNYRVHIQDVGWCDPVHDGQTAGTIGYSKRLEAIKLTPPEGWIIRAKLHIQNVGWVTYNDASKATLGTVGRSQAIECIMFDVTQRPENDNRKLYFRVHQQNTGWKSWTPEGFASGTDGMGLRLEALEMVIR